MFSQQSEILINVKYVIFEVPYRSNLMMPSSIVFSEKKKPRNADNEPEKKTQANVNKLFYRLKFLIIAAEEILELQTILARSLVDS
jgi:hypothetical protein